MNKTRLLNVLCLFSFILIISKTALAVNVSYDFTGTCQQADWDCGPLGVLDSAVDAVTGSLTLNLLEPTVAQTWDKDTVLSYSFTFGNFTIDNTNSTLSNELRINNTGNIPFTTSATSPYTFGDGFLRAIYTPDPSVDLRLDIGGINLVQGSLGGCTGTCQALALGSWTRTSVVPVPAAVWFFGSGLIGLIGVARRKKA